MPRIDSRKATPSFYLEPFSKFPSSFTGPRVQPVFHPGPVLFPGKPHRQSVRHKEERFGRNRKDIGVPGVLLIQLFLRCVYGIMNIVDVTIMNTFRPDTVTGAFLHPAVPGPDVYTATAGVRSS